MYLFFTVLLAIDIMQKLHKHANKGREIISLCSKQGKFLGGNKYKGGLVPLRWYQI